jgi:hypothetical protein
MKKHTFALLFFLLVIALGAASAFAQAPEDFTVPVTLTDNYTIMVPEGWESRDGLNDGFIISDGTRFLYVMDPTVIAETIDLDRSPLMQDIMSQLFQLQYNAAIDIDEIIDSRIDGKTAMTYTYSIGDIFTGTFVLLQLAEQEYMLFDLTGPNDDFVDPSIFVAQVAATLAQGAQATPVAVSTIVPCLLASSETTDVAVRIGPGENRAIILYMPRASEHRATGQFSDEDGGLWLRVSKLQLAPDVAADELWVFAEDVMTTGDCTVLTRVGGRDIIAAAPPITAFGTGRTTGGGGVPASIPPDASAALGFVPRGGAWRLSFDTTAYQSCRAGDQQGQTNTAPTRDILGDFADGYSSPINVAADGRSFTYYGTTYTLQQGGVYVGGQAFGDGVSQTTRLRPLSQTQMTGEFTINIPGSDFACSVTIYVTVRRGG